MRPVRLLVVASIVLCALYAAELVSAYRGAPTADAAREHFDVIIVLGNPSLDDGTPSPEQRARIQEGIREFKRGVAPHLITTGGAVLNDYAEGHSMAVQAEAAGVPQSSITEETYAENTVQNIAYSLAIMRQHGWTSAEVVSSPSHLPRTGLILSHYQGEQRIEWRTHAAAWPPRYLHHLPKKYFLEANACLLFRAIGFRRNEHMPVARPLHAAGF